MGCFLFSNTVRGATGKEGLRGDKNSQTILQWTWIVLTYVRYGRFGRSGTAATAVAVIELTGLICGIIGTATVGKAKGIKKASVR